MFADIQGFFGNVFLAGAATVGFWMYLLSKLNKGAEAKQIAGGWVIRLLRALFK
jgi:hypothetical protein